MYYSKEKSLFRLKISEEELLYWRSIGHIKYSERTDKYDIDSVFVMRTMTIGLDKLLNNDQREDLVDKMSKQSSLYRRIFSDLQNGKAYTANEYDKIGQKEYGLMSYYGLCAYQYAQGQFNSMSSWYCKTITNLEDKIVKKREELKEASTHNNDFRPDFFKGKKKQIYFLSNKLSKYQSKGYLGTWFGNKKPDDKEAYIKSRLSLVVSGEEAHKGNRYIRIEKKDDDYYLKLFKDYISIKIPSSHRYTFDQRRQTMRISFNKDGKLVLNVTYVHFKPIQKNLISKSKGVVGIDIGPKEVACSFVKNDGNVKSHIHFSTGNILDKRSKDTDRCLSEICDTIVKQAIYNSMYSIAVENLQFKPDHSFKSKRLNRMLSKFPRRKFLSLLESKCSRNGIRLKLINPAYTSVIGLFKYSNINNLCTSHNANSKDLSASIVIARRGIGLNEKAVVCVRLFGKIVSISVKSLLDTLEDVSNKFNRKSEVNSNWSLWSMLKRHFNTTDELTAHILANPQTYVDLVGDEILKAKLLQSMN